MTRNDTGSSARPNKVYSGGEAKQEEEERGAEHLQQLLPVFHLDVFQDDEAQEKASDGAAEVGDHAVPSLNVVVTSVGSVTKVECPEAKDRCHLKNPGQLPPKGKRRLVLAKPLTKGVYSFFLFLETTWS